MKRKETNGITLIALVVTVVILLILAGVSINMTLGNNGIVTKAKEAKDKYATASEDDLKWLNELMEKIDDAVEESEYPETVPYLPSEDFQYDKSTSIDTGLVIRDSDGNEYVWVVVPRRKQVYPTIGLGKTEFTDEDYENIQEDLKNYINIDRIFYHPHSTSGDEEYCNMLKSIYLNGGFYVGRYEAGIDINRTSQSEEITKVPLSKPSVYPYTYITCTQAINLAKRVNSGNYTSSLLYGIQYELLMKFMRNDTSKITSLDVLTEDSKSIGNYRNSSFDLNRGKYAQYGKTSNEWKNFDEELDTIVVRNEKTGKMQKKEQSEETNSIVLTTGATEHSRVMNIYDVAGNVGEWLFESSINAYGNPCLIAGGRYSGRRRYSIRSCANNSFK